MLHESGWAAASRSSDRGQAKRTTVAGGGWGDEGAMSSEVPGNVVWYKQQCSATREYARVAAD